MTALKELNAPAVENADFWLKLQGFTGHIFVGESNEEKENLPPKSVGKLQVNWQVAAWYDEIKLELCGHHTSAH